MATENLRGANAAPRPSLTLHRILEDAARCSHSQLVPVTPVKGVGGMVSVYTSFFQNIPFSWVF